MINIPDSRLDFENAILAYKDKFFKAKDIKELVIEKKVTSFSVKEILEGKKVESRNELVGLIRRNKRVNRKNTNKILNYISMDINNKRVFGK